MLKHRVLTAVLLAPPVVAGIWFLPTVVVAAVAGAILLLAQWEWARMVPVRNGFARGLYLAITAALMLAAWYAGPASLAAGAEWIGVLGWTCVLFWLLSIESGRGTGALSAPVKAAGGAVVLLVAWLLLTRLHLSSQGPVWFLLLLAVVWAADISAYFAGRRFGRRKLAPSISPGKTWAGAWGGLAGGALTILGGGLLVGLGPERLAGLVLLGMATVVFSIVGDLFESLVKRQAGAKDSSTLLPGHGGVFDRVDSLLAAVPVYTLGLEWVNA